MSTAEGLHRMGPGGTAADFQPLHLGGPVTEMPEGPAYRGLRQRILESRAAQAIAGGLAVLTLAGVVAKGASSEATAIAGTPVAVGTNIEKNGGQVPAAPGVVPGPEAKPQSDAICDKVDTAKLLESMGIPPNSMPMGQITCDSNPKPGTLMASTPLKGYGRWDFPTTGRNSTYMKYIEIAKIDEGAMGNGMSVFATLQSKSTPQSKYSGNVRNTTLGGMNVRVVDGAETFREPDGTRAGAGKLLVNVPEAGVNVLMSSSSAYATDPQVVTGLNIANEQALASLLPTIVQQ